jgi:hypothetical protein
MHFLFFELESSLSCIIRDPAGYLPQKACPDMVSTAKVDQHEVASSNRSKRRIITPARQEQNRIAQRIYRMLVLVLEWRLELTYLLKARDRKSAELVPMLRAGERESLRLNHHPMYQNHCLAIHLILTPSLYYSTHHNH